jgi:hypothetical protein
MKKILQYSIISSICLVMLFGGLLVGRDASADATAGTAGASEGVEIVDPLNLGDNPIPNLANRLIQTALGLTGILALLSFIYGGILYMLVGVNPDNVKKGKEVMKWSVVGLFIIFSSYAILNFILGTVLGLK